MMSHLEILLGEKQSSTVTKEKLRKLPGTEGFVFALIEDVFEPFHELGEKVFAGWKAVLVHSLVNPFEMPGVVHYEVDRILHGVWMIGKVVKGNCCAPEGSRHAGHGPHGQRARARKHATEL